MQLNSIEEILDDIRQGKMVIIMDDEDRENEGDLLMASSMVRPEDINFMAQYGRGLICMTLTRERCRQLNLPLMVSQTHDEHGTNFTISIEASEGVTTGISAYDRALTVRAATAPNAVPDDIEQPGHIFPLMAQAGGVLTRAGHTEAGCDLARLADLEPSSTIVEILKEDGTMARRADLEIFAKQHDLKIGTIEDLIRYRIANEKTVERVASKPWPVQTSDETITDFELYAYRDISSKKLDYALVLGEPNTDEATLVRVHVQRELCDLFSPGPQSCGWPLQDAIRRIANNGSGVIVVLHQESDPDAILRELRGEAPQTKAGSKGANPGDDANERSELRTFGVGAQILADVGVSKMRILGTPMVMHGLSGFGLEVVDYIDR